MELANKFMRRRARELRRAATPEEQMLWSLVRGRQLGWPVRRQHPIGNFILDFYCAAAWLGVELDGRHHDVRFDDLRDAELLMHGVAVMRFENREVRENAPAVAREIRETIHRRATNCLMYRSPNGPAKSLSGLVGL